MSETPIPGVRYGLRCDCHGVRLYETPRQRDAHAITYQCKQEWFRVVPPNQGEAMESPDTERGLYGKYRVEKVNGKPVGQCFVLAQHDPHAVAALRAYAASCADEYISLATDLSLMADCWEEAHTSDA